MEQRFAAEVEARFLDSPGTSVCKGRGTGYAPGFREFHLRFGRNAVNTSYPSRGAPLRIDVSQILVTLAVQVAAGRPVCRGTC